MMEKKKNGDGEICSQDLVDLGLNSRPTGFFAAPRISSRALVRVSVMILGLVLEPFAKPLSLARALSFFRERYRPNEARSSLPG